MKTLASIIALMVVLHFFAFCWLYYAQVIPVNANNAFVIGLVAWIIAVLGFEALGQIGKQTTLARICFVFTTLITVLNFFVFLWLRVITPIISYPKGDGVMAMGSIFGVMAFIAGIFLVEIAKKENPEDFF